LEQINIYGLCEFKLDKEGKFSKIKVTKPTKGEQSRVKYTDF